MAEGPETGTEAGKPVIKAVIVPVTPFQQNCTLVWDEATRVGAVVDPGGDLDRVRAAITQHGVGVEKILLTHGHIDHAGGAAELAETLGVPIEGPHRADLFLLERLAESGAGYGIPGKPFVPGRWLDEGDAVTVGPLSFSVLHCPGHSPGSVVLVSDQERFALVGDVLFRGSVGRADLPGGDMDTLIRSIREKLLTLGDDVAFICGHGPTSTIGRERTSNPYLV